MRSSDTTKVVGALVLGAAAGAVLGVLFAPKKGSETRKDIADNAKKMSKNLKNKFQGQVDDFKKTASREVKELRKQADQAEKFIESKAGSLRDVVENKVADAKSNLNHKVDNVVEAAKS